MTRVKVRPTGRESPFGEGELIVSKTDLKGRITYANSVFQRVSRYAASELIGEPHSIIRHPDMPRCVFKLLWDTIEAGEEIFAYVLNMAANGDHYWVFAHVTPTFGSNGEIVGYHSNRRKPSAEQIAKVVPLYREVYEIEERNADGKIGLHQSYERLTAYLRDQGVGYDQFVFSI